MKSRKVVLQQTELYLLPEKAVFLPAFSTLCIADWHLGKAAHFRKGGIALPQPDLSPEFEKITQLIERYKAEQVILLGDVFHSDLNKDWDRFESFIKTHSQIRWIITMGNHDIIGKTKFTSIGIHATDRFLLGNTVVCTHHPAEPAIEGQLNLCGHVHPGCEMYTPSRQTFKLPCFHYSNTVLTLPAFGTLTGLFILKADMHNRIFPIIGDEVKEMPFKG